MDVLTHDPNDFQELLTQEREIVGAKFAGWDNYVNDRLPGADFQSNYMLALRLQDGDYFSSLSQVVESEEYMEGIAGGFVEHAGYTILFGLSEKKLFDVESVAERSVTITTLKFDPIIEYEMKMCGLWRELKNATKSVSRQTNHDFMHNATLRSGIFNAEFDADNKRPGTRIIGYENFVLAMHSEVFVSMREDQKRKGQAIPEVVEKVFDSACRMDDVIKKFLETSDNSSKHDMADALYNFLHYMLRNMVSGKEFLGEDGKFSHDRGKWLEALMRGQPERVNDFIIRDIKHGEPRSTSISEISVLCQRSFMPESHIMRAEKFTSERKPECLRKAHEHGGIENRLAKIMGGNTTLVDHGAVKG